MAKFGFNLLGYRYQVGLRHIHMAYSASFRALDEQLDAMIDQAFTYQERLESGEIEWIGERDEDGHILWSQNQVNDMAVDDANECIPALNKGFIPILYHHWERGARLLIAHYRPSKNPEGNDWKYIDKHEKLVEWLERFGLVMDPRLSTLITLNNALKHNNARYGRILLATAPHFFPQGYDPDNPASDLYQSIAIGVDDIKRFIEIVGKSGATADTVISFGGGRVSERTCASHATNPLRV